MAYTLIDEQESQPIKIGADAFPDFLKQELANTDWGTRNIAGMGSAVVNGWEGLKGLVGQTDQNQVRDQNIIAESAPVGNIAGNMAMMAPTAMIPGANTVTGAATIGAVQGALLTPGELSERIKAAFMGGAGGAAGTKIANMASRALPKGVNPDVELLQDAGVGLTPGQNAGGLLKSFEDKATSYPFLGEVIQNARKRGMEDFNQAAYRRAIPSAPGTTSRYTGQAGNDAVDALQSNLTNKYDALLNSSRANVLEPEFVNKMASLRQLASGLPQREQQALDNIISREIEGRMSPNGWVNQENVKSVEEALGKQAKNFQTAQDGYQRDLGDVVKQVQQEFRDLLGRSNPQNAADLKRVNAAYANFKRIQRAASSVAAEDGVFSPAQLHNAVKTLDKSKDHSAFARGKALMQDLSSAGKNVLPSKVPDSGSPGRLLGNLLAHPIAGMGSAALSIPAMAAYSRTGSKLINGAMNNGMLPLRNHLVAMLGKSPDAARIAGSVAPLSYAELFGD
jgi:hypothetical protein